MKNKIENLKYVNDQTSTSGKPVLCKLRGPVADLKNPTRNLRGYSEELWNKSLESDLVKESFDNGGLLLELGHPVDRQEVDYERVAAVMPKPPVKDIKTNLLMGEVEVIDTPMGRIANTLAQYGYKLGISSRGTGDVVTDDDGNEIVDPDTYELTTWDLVVLPAVKNARLQLVTESVGNKTLKQALNESLASSTEEEQALMKEALEGLHIDYSLRKEDDNIKTEDKDTLETKGAVDNGTLELIKSLQEAVKSKAESDAKLLVLQCELAVSNAKVNKIEDELSKYKSTTIKLSDVAKDAKDLKTTVAELTEKIEYKERTIAIQKDSIQRLTKSLKESKTAITESVQSKEGELKKLQENLRTLRADKLTFEKEREELTESVKKVQETLETEKQKLTEEITKSKQITEKYKRIANDTVRRYIDSKAKMIGVSANEIKNKLSETYTIDDVDKVCEELKSYELNISRLPFNVDRKVKVKVTESKRDLTNRSTDDGDEIDDSLMALANLK